MDPVGLLRGPLIVTVFRLNLFEVCSEILFHYSHLATVNHNSKLCNYDQLFGRHRSRR